jgi:type VI secretion system secreted protein Hcp
MASDIFLKLDGIKGEATAKGHVDEIELHSWSFGVTNSSIGGGSGQGAGKATFHDISLTHAFDASSPPLMQACATGKHFPKAVLTQRKAGGDQLEYIKIELDEVFITGVNANGHESPSESFTISFGKIKMDYQPQDEKGAKKGGTIPGTFNLKAVTK